MGKVLWNYTCTPFRGFSCHLGSCILLVKTNQEHPPMTQSTNLLLYNKSNKAHTELEHQSTVRGATADGVIILGGLVFVTFPIDNTESSDPLSVWIITALIMLFPV